MGPYQYAPLPEGACIRVIGLQPGAGEDPLVFTLDAVDLDQHAVFEAISYVWGSAEKSHTLTCNDSAIDVTASLAAALRQVRLTDRVRLLWADAICINQADLTEQGSQVALMGQIYSMSTCTLICLGYEEGGKLEGEAHRAAGLIDEVDAMIQRTFQDANFSWQEDSFPFPRRDDSILSDGRWKALAQMLDAPWFFRSWCVQEAARSQDARVLWADATIDWIKVLRVYRWMWSRAVSHKRANAVWLSPLHWAKFELEHARENATFWSGNIAENKPFSLPMSLDFGRGLGVTDPRDRIYAFLGLPSCDAAVAVRPDYRKHYTLVYRDFAEAYMRCNPGLELLHYVQHDEETLSDGRLASWVPRWDRSLLMVRGANTIWRTVHFPSPHGEETQVVSVHDPTVLQVRAVIMDAVVYTSAVFRESNTGPLNIARVFKHVSTGTQPCAYREEELLPGFLHVLLMGSKPPGSLDEWRRQRSAYTILLQEADTAPGSSIATEAGSPVNELTPDAQHFQWFYINPPTRNRRFIVLGRGLWGLAPGIVRTGDVCCIISGTRTPFMLRKTDREGHYKILGAVYMLSSRIDHDWPDAGVLYRLGGDESHDDWVDWGLQEESIVIC